MNSSSTHNSVLSVPKSSGIASEQESDPNQREVLYLHEFEELKLRLSFSVAAFAPVCFLSRHFPVVSGSGSDETDASTASAEKKEGSVYIRASPAAVRSLLTRLVASDPVAAVSAGISLESEENQQVLRNTQLDNAYLHDGDQDLFAEAERGDSDDIAGKLSEDFGAAGMMDEDMPFAVSHSDPMPHMPSTPNTKRRSSLSAALEGSMVTTFLPVSICPDR